MFAMKSDKETDAWEEGYFDKLSKGFPVEISGNFVILLRRYRPYYDEEGINYYVNTSAYSFDTRESWTTALEDLYLNKPTRNDVVAFSIQSRASVKMVLKAEVSLEE